MHRRHRESRIAHFERCRSWRNVALNGHRFPGCEKLETDEGGGFQPPHKADRIKWLFRLRKNSAGGTGFERARLQSCRKCNKIKAENLAHEGRILEYFTAN